MYRCDWCGQNKELNVLKAVENVGGATYPFLRDSTIIVLKSVRCVSKKNIEKKP